LPLAGRKTTGTTRTRYSINFRFVAHILTLSYPVTNILTGDALYLSHTVLVLLLLVCHTSYPIPRLPHNGSHSF